MSGFKQLHKHRLRLLALHSISDVVVKELFCCLLSRSEQVEDEDPCEPIITRSFNPNRFLSELLKKEDVLQNLHFVTSYPAVQNIIFENIYPDLDSVKEEVMIGKLDTIVVCEMLTHIPEIFSLLKKESLVKPIETIQYFRILLATTENDLFWDGLDHGMKLSVYSHTQNWELVWKENKQSVVKILKFLKETDIIRESEYQKRMEEINLVSTWSKQEILQNLTRSLNQQWKSLSFLHLFERQFGRRKEKRIAIHLSGQQPTALGNDKGWLRSFTSYFKSFFYTQIEESSSILDYDLDSTVVKTMSKLMQELAVNTFGHQGFMDIKLLDVTKGIRVLDEEENAIISLTVYIVFDNTQNDAISLCNLYSEDSKKIWQQISSEIKNCIQQKLNIFADCIRIGWFSETKQINLCIFKENDDSWTPEEESSLIKELMNWEFPYKLVVKTNREILENVATLTFNLSSTNARYFDVMDKFVKMIHDSSISINTQDDIETIDIAEGLGITSNLSIVKDLASQLVIKQDEFDLLGESHTSLELNSARSDGPNSSRKSSPRFLTSPKQNVKQKHTDVTNLEHQEKEGIDIPDIVVTKEGEKVSSKTTKRYSGIPKNSNGTKTKSNPENNPGTPIETTFEPTEDWLTLQVVKEFLLKPALLSVLHNDNKTPNTRSFQRDTKKLYQSVKNLHKNHPKAFEIWRKSEMCNVLLPNDGQEETNTNQWSIDMIYFVIRTSNMLPQPRNGWQHPKQPSEEEDSRAFWCWEGRRLKNEIDHGKVDCVQKLLERVEEMFKALGYKNDMLLKLKDCTYFKELVTVSE